MRLIRALPALLFGLTFTVGGVFFLHKFAYPMLHDWYTMKTWRPAYAQLLTVSGAENETRASYQYEYDGILHHGDRVYIATWKDNIGPYHKNLLSRLKHEKQTGEPISIWVNPDDPAQAVIDRDMRWGLLVFIGGFSSIFILIGSLVTYGGFKTRHEPPGQTKRSLRELRKEWDEKKTDPLFKSSFIEYSRQQRAAAEEALKDRSTFVDWRTRKGWESSTVGSNARPGLFAAWGFAVVWNAISSPLLFVLPEELNKGNYLVLLGLLFPVVGAYLLYRAVRATSEYRRFGRVLFEMDPYPGSIGGHVGGHIHAARLPFNLATDSGSEVKVVLECVYSYMSGSGDDRSRHDDIKWFEEGHPRVEHAAEGVKLTFRFSVPDGLPEADTDQTGAYHFWRLKVTANIPGTDLDRQYNIPVFRTHQTSRSVHHDISAQSSKRQAEESEMIRQSIGRGNFDIPGLSRAMRFRESNNGEIIMVFPTFRNKALSIVTAVFAGGFGFATWSLGGIAFKGGLFGLLTALFAIPFALVALVAGVAAVYLPFNNLRVHITRTQISVLRRLLFLPIYSKTLNVSDVSSLSLKRSGSTGQGARKVEHFKLHANLRGGVKVTLAEDLDGEATAGHFRDYLGRRLNIESLT